MNDDWLDTGHGTDPAHLAEVFSRGASDVAPITGADRPSRRFAGRISLAAVAAAAVLASAGTTFAIRESLFPSLGAPTARSVWQNPAPPTSALQTTTTSTTEPDVVTRPATQPTIPATTTVSAPVVTTAVAPSSTSVPGARGTTVTTIDGDSSESGGDDSDARGRGTDDSSGRSPAVEDDPVDDASGGSGTSGGSNSGSGSGSGTGSGSGSSGSDSRDDSIDD